MHVYSHKFTAVSFCAVIFIAGVFFVLVPMSTIAQSSFDPYTENIDSLKREASSLAKKISLTLETAEAKGSLLPATGPAGKSFFSLGNVGLLLLFITLLFFLTLLIAVRRSISRLTYPTSRQRQHAGNPLVSLPIPENTAAPPDIRTITEAKKPTLVIPSKVVRIKVRKLRRSKK